MTHQITTTLNKIRKCEPCKDGWEKLLKFLGKTKADDERLKFSTIIESNGIKDAIWCLRCISSKNKKKLILFAADCAESVLHLFEEKYPEDKRPRLAIEAARKFANGEITKEKLKIAAEDATSAYAAYASAAAVEAAAVEAAAWAAAVEAASSAAVAASSAADAARFAADTVRDVNVELKKQKKFLIKWFS